MIVIRHPNDDEFHRIKRKIFPWIRYAAKTGSTLLFSTFQSPHERYIRDALAEAVAGKVSPGALHVFDKNDGACWYKHPQTGKIYYPDYYAFRIN